MGNDSIQINIEINSHSLLEIIYYVFLIIATIIFKFYLIAKVAMPAYFKPAKTAQYLRF